MCFRRDVSCFGFRLEWKTANTTTSFLLISQKIANGNCLTIVRLRWRWINGNLRFVWPGTNLQQMYPDFKELLLAFNAHNVEYLIVGAHALAAHGPCSH